MLPGSQYPSSLEEHMSMVVARDVNQLYTDLEDQGPAPWKLNTDQGQSLGNGLIAGRMFAQGEYGMTTRNMPTHVYTEQRDLSRLQIDESMVGSETINLAASGHSQTQVQALPGQHDVSYLATPH